MNKKFNLTLAEGTPCIDRCIHDMEKQSVCPLLGGSARRAKGVRNVAFTLAEVLITLAIIGVVAAITIPGLVTTIKDKVSQRQIQVAEKRLAEGVRLYSQLDSGFNGRTYEDTYDFLKNGLSKHFKMTSICDAEHIADCWPGGKINLDSGEVVDVSTLKTLDKLNLDDEAYYTPASFISGAGIPYIVALKKDCIIDPDSGDNLGKDCKINPTTNQQECTVMENDPLKCIDGLWDYNGPRTPNKQSVDVRSLGSAVAQGTPAGPSCYSSPGGVCIAIQPFYATSAMANLAGGNCSTLQSGGEITDTEGVFGTPGAKLKVKNSFSGCPFSTDYWLASKLKCESMGYRLPTNLELAQIAAGIFGYTGEVSENWNYSGTRGDITQYGFELYPSYSKLYLWSGVELTSSTPSKAYYRLIGTEGTSNSGYNERRNVNDLQAVCVLGN